MGPEPPVALITINFLTVFRRLGGGRAVGDRLQRAIQYAANFGSIAGVSDYRIARFRGR
jgi:hypothetical protein